MEAELKAKELYNKFATILMQDLSEGTRKHAKTLYIEDFAKLVNDEMKRLHTQAKKCALECADQLIEFSDPTDYDFGLTQKEYFQKVKDEILKYK